jgi:hypothetical protein
MAEPKERVPRGLKHKLLAPGLVEEYMRSSGKAPVERSRPLTFSLAKGGVISSFEG